MPKWIVYSKGRLVYAAVALLDLALLLISDLVFHAPYWVLPSGSLLINIATFVVAMRNA